MNPTDLIATLLELVAEARKSDVRLILAGGLGVLLRVELARASGEMTLGSLSICTPNRRRTLQGSRSMSVAYARAVSMVCTLAVSMKPLAAIYTQSWFLSRQVA